MNKNSTAKSGDMSALVLRPQPMRRLSHAVCQTAVVRLRGSAARMSASRMRPNSAHTARRGRAALLHSLHSMLAAGPCKGSYKRHTCATSTLPCPAAHAAHPRHSVAYACPAPGARAGTHPTSWFSHDPACYRTHWRLILGPSVGQKKRMLGMHGIFGHHRIATALQEQDLMEKCTT